MKLVIDISKDIYNDIVNYNLSLTKADELCRAVVNGTPLPKGYGRLIDADAVFNNIFPKANIKSDALENMKAYPYWKTDITGLQNILNNAPTIIEADKED